MKYNPERNLITNNYGKTEYANLNQGSSMGAVATIKIPEAKGGETITVALTVNTSSAKKIRARFDTYDATGENRIAVHRKDDDSDYAENEEKRISVTSTLDTGTKVIIIYLDSNLTQKTIPTDSTEQVKEACCYIGSESTAFRLAPENTTTMGDSIAADSITI